MSAAAKPLPVQPTSPFPYSPLTDYEAGRLEASWSRVLVLYAIDGKEPGPSAVQHGADCVRGGEVRCGYQRDGWPAA